MKNKWNGYDVIRSLVTAIILAGFAIFFYRYRNDFLSLKIVNPLLLILVASTAILFLLSNSWLNKIVFEVFGIAPSFGECLAITSISSIGNFVVPMRAGLVLMAVYLKKRYDFSYATFLGTLPVVYMVIFWVNSLAGLASMVAIWCFFEKFSWLIFLTFACCFAGLSFLVFYSPCFPPFGNKHIDRLISVINSWYKIRANRKSIVKMALAALANVVVIATMTYFEFSVLGTKISFVQALFLSIFSSFSLLLSVTPASLGIREIFSAYSGNVLGLPLPVVIAASIIDRLVNFAVSAISGGCLWYGLLMKHDNET